MKKLFLLLALASMLQAHSDEENQPAHEHSFHYTKKYQRAVDVLLGAATGAGALSSSAYIFSLIDTYCPARSKYLVMASAGVISSSLATAILYTGGENLSKKFEFTCPCQETNEQKEPKNKTFYSLAFLTSYLAIICGYTGAHTLLEQAL